MCQSDHFKTHFARINETIARTIKDDKACGTIGDRLTCELTRAALFRAVLYQRLARTENSRREQAAEMNPEWTHQRFLKTACPE